NNARLQSGLRRPCRLRRTPLQAVAHIEGKLIKKLNGISSFAHVSIALISSLGYVCEFFVSLATVLIRLTY
ncbi:hypothetical protein, partial [Escherichia coli]|uniref:hypothetical protein n=1 Tax=Escherichia coli TaxID=562 RepID=UPI001BC86690